MGKGHKEHRIRLRWVEGKPGYVCGEVKERGTWKQGIASDGSREGHWRDIQRDLLAWYRSGGAAAGAPPPEQVTAELRRIGAPVGGRPAGSVDSKRRKTRSDKGSKRGVDSSYIADSDG